MTGRTTERPGDGTRSGNDRPDTRREHWDRIALSLPDLRSAPSTSYYREMEIRLVTETFHSLHGKRILKLDLWNEAVNTRILNWMVEQGAVAYGIDISHVTAVRAEKNVDGQLRRPIYVQSDILHLPFGDNYFDHIYTMGTIEHVPDYTLPLAEIRRVLKPGGTAIIGVPHKWDIFLRPLVVRVLDLFGAYLYAPERSVSANEMKQAVTINGLHVKNRTGLLLIPGVLRMADLFCYTRRIPSSFLIRLLMAPFAELERRYPPLRKFGYLLTMIVEKPQ